MFTLPFPRRGAPRRAATPIPWLALFGTLCACAGGPSEPGPDDDSRTASQEEPGAAASDGPTANGGTPEGVDVATVRTGPAPLGASAHDPLAGFPTGERQRRIFCGRPGTNPVKTALCNPNLPKIQSLVDLQRALDLDFRANPRAAQTADGAAPSAPVDPAKVNTNGRVNPQFAFNAHSTSLVTRFTSSINPRAIIFRQAALSFTAMGFVRGEQFVELATRASNGSIAFSLVSFRQACNDRPGGCTHGDLYTPSVEKDWTSYSVYGAEDLKNSVMDCAQCHQPGGPRTASFLRMQELQVPWTHWMRIASLGGLALIADYNLAKNGESYAGIPRSELGRTDPLLVQLLVQIQSFNVAQPNTFATGRIESEVAGSARGQPFSNNTRGKSATWDALYAKNVAGETIQVPYHDVKVTDPAKLAARSRAYTEYRNGTLPKDQLPDMSDVFSDDRAVLAELGFAPKPGLDGHGLIKQLCTQCHNAKLDQTISRARFNADLSKMSKEEKNVAIQRLLLPDHDIRAMPPSRFRTVTDEERQKMIDVLKE